MSEEDLNQEELSTNDANENSESDLRHLKHNTETPESNTEDSKHTSEMDFIQEEEADLVNLDPPPDEIDDNATKLSADREYFEGSTQKNQTSSTHASSSDEDWLYIQRNKFDKDLLINLNKNMELSDYILQCRERLIMNATYRKINRSYYDDWRNFANKDFKRLVMIKSRLKRYKEG